MNHAELCRSSAGIMEQSYTVLLQNVSLKIRQKFLDFQWKFPWMESADSLHKVSKNSAEGQQKLCRKSAEVLQKICINYTELWRTSIWIMLSCAEVLQESWSRVIQYFCRMSLWKFGTNFWIFNENSHGWSLQKVCIKSLKILQKVCRSPAENLHKLCRVMQNFCMKHAELCRSSAGIMNQLCSTFAGFRSRNSTQTSGDSMKISMQGVCRQSAITFARDQSKSLVWATTCLSAVCLKYMSIDIWCLVKLKQWEKGEKIT